MGLGFSKTFAIVVIFSAAWAYYVRDLKAMIPPLLFFSIFKIAWNLLTQGNGKKT